MRIIAGKFKGRLIEMPKGIRPTSDKVREALFEILKADIGGAAFLDLYCGSGAIGIEALSRGAKSVTFVDNNFKCIRVLKRNLMLAEVSPPPSICLKDVLKGIKEIKGSFDIIFLDPPYYKDIAKKTLIALSDCDILPRNVLVIVEAHKKDILPEETGTLKKIRTCKYGDTKLEFYKK
ncbi:16S rRNA (guanine(966)-N(2))-methyltransferase RsmD [Candidatus Omnitrophota bacterium]